MVKFIGEVYVLLTREQFDFLGLAPLSREHEISQEPKWKPVACEIHGKLKNNNTLNPFNTVIISPCSFSNLAHILTYFKKADTS